MRDPVLYRIKFAEHHQTGSKWCITRCTTLLTASAMRWKALLILCVRWVRGRKPSSVRLGTGQHRHSGFHPRQYEFSRLNLEYLRDVPSVAEPAGDRQTRRRLG